MDQGNNWTHKDRASGLSMKTLSTDVEICGAKRDRLPEILALLQVCELPKEGLATHLSKTLVARRGNEIVGCSALEVYQELALLRSVAVKPSFRKRGHILLQTRLRPSSTFRCARDYQTLSRVYHAVSEDCHGHDDVFGLAQL